MLLRLRMNFCESSTLGLRETLFPMSVPMYSSLACLGGIVAAALALALVVTGRLDRAERPPRDTAMPVTALLDGGRLTAVEDYSSEVARDKEMYVEVRKWRFRNGAKRTACSMKNRNGGERLIVMEAKGLS